MSNGKPSGEIMNYKFKIRRPENSEFSLLKKWTASEQTFNICVPRDFTYPLTDDQLDRYFNETQQARPRHVALVLLKGDRVIGHLRFSKIDYTCCSASLQFVIIGDVKLRGQGIGKKFISMALEYIKENPGIKTVRLAVFSNNAPALQCYKSLGFEIMEAVHLKDRNYSRIIMQKTL